MAWQLPAQQKWTVLAWNDLGMHCMDADYSVFAILPPFNNLHAQVIDSSGKLVKSGTGITVTYEAVADPNGSINSTSQGKTNFWQYVQALFGVSPDPDTGLAGNAMPGPSNTPQPFTFDAATSSFIATGVPATAYDDGGNRNFYPMFRVVVKDSGGNVLASTNMVAPISDEMNCVACHSSESSSAAQPQAGWVNDADPVRDYRLNILLKHDDLQGGTDQYQQALAAAGYNSAGLYQTVTGDGTPVLCANCHATNALGYAGVAGVPPLTASVHAMHATVVDPATGMTLDDTNNRTACYQCHPGSQTKCLRGVMGSAVNPDGTQQMQCQSCHGSMSAVGDPSRNGWYNEPNCQACHSGTAKQGATIRYTSALDSSGQLRMPADNTFATTPNAPVPGFSLYRASSGHGGLQCEACHGSTHAEYPSLEGNDNVQSQTIQGHAGMLVECASCHGGTPSTTNGGPHGLHPVGQAWVSLHRSAARAGTSACQPCHGMDYRGTVLSATRADRSFSIERGVRSFPKGTQISCYNCHNGPGGE